MWFWKLCPCCRTASVWNLLARRDWKAVSYAAGFAVMLALMPSLYFGFQGNLDLLGQWASQESQTQLGDGEIWFPNQSLRGMLIRTGFLCNHTPHSGDRHCLPQIFRQNRVTRPFSETRPLLTMLGGKFIFLRTDFANEHNLKPAGAIISTYEELQKRRPAGGIGGGG